MLLLTINPSRIVLRKHWTGEYNSGLWKKAFSNLYRPNQTLPFAYYWMFYFCKVFGSKYIEWDPLCDPAAEVLVQNARPRGVSRVSIGIFHTTNKKLWRTRKPRCTPLLILSSSSSLRDWANQKSVCRFSLLRACELEWWNMFTIIIIIVICECVYKFWWATHR